jgi:RHS repeat-associated protein
MAIYFTAGRSIKLVYDASGAKLQKITTENGVSTTYDYVNGVEYKNAVLQRIAHTEGSVSIQTDGSYMHEYVLRDHLGNTRVTFKDIGNDGTINDVKTEITQINSYYPFGMNMDGNINGAAGKNKYQYNGKEWNDDFSLGWNDYGARFYDPALARWSVIDPLAEKFISINPYNYVMNRPTVMIDPNGMEAIFNAQTGELNSATGEDARNWLRGQQKAAQKKAGGMEYANARAGIKIMAGGTELANVAVNIYATMGKDGKYNVEKDDIITEGSNSGPFSKLSVIDKRVKTRNGKIILSVTYQLEA